MTMRPGGQLARSGRLRPVSAKRARVNRERAKMVAAMTGGVPVPCAVPGCYRLAVDAHEVLTRARGGSITDPGNVRLICREHHDEIGTEPAWAYVLGFLVHSWEGPNEPVRLDW